MSWKMLWAGRLVGVRIGIKSHHVYNFSELQMVLQDSTDDTHAQIKISFVSLLVKLYLK